MQVVGHLDDGVELDAWVGLEGAPKEKAKSLDALIVGSQPELGSGAANGHEPPRTGSKASRAPHR